MPPDETKKQATEALRQEPKRAVYDPVAYQAGYQAGIHAAVASIRADLKKLLEKLKED